MVVLPVSAGPFVKMMVWDENRACGANSMMNSDMVRAFATSGLRTQPIRPAFGPIIGVAGHAPPTHQYWPFVGIEAADRLTARRRNNDSS